MGFEKKHFIQIAVCALIIVICSVLYAWYYKTYLKLGTEFYSQITTSHHLLFINKDKNLLGFPVSTYIKNKQLEGLILYRVDLENNKFEEIKDLVLEKNSNGLSRFIYIGDYIYGLYYKRIEKYDINSFEKVQEVPVPSESKLEYYYNTRNVILD